ncbi:hypothetical protein HMPREF1502_5939, partial [Klebsiella sp. AS10]
MSAPQTAVPGAKRHHLPEAMLRIYPGYRPADGGEPVARARRV